MMRTLHKILLGFVALSALLSCTKEGHQDNMPAEKITFAPYLPETKTGFIDDINAGQYEMVVYDYMTKDNSAGWYMDGVGIVCDGQGNWSYSATTTEREYIWMDKSNHYFYGWLSTSSALFTPPSTPTFDEDNRELSIPKVTFGTSSPLYDFLYSSETYRYYSKDGSDATTGATEAGGDSSPVPLEMKHLFSAYRFKIQNKRGTDITVNSATLKGIQTTKSAIIYFSKGAAVQYQDVASADISGINQAFTLSAVTDPSAAVTATNLFARDDNGGNGFLMIWPQDDTEFASAQIVINYTEGGTTKDVTFMLKDLGYTEWIPGQRYAYTITFTDKEIMLECVVQPWEYEEQEIDFSDEVTITERMHWSNVESINEATGEVVLYTSDEIVAEGRFKIDGPKGATWTASLIPLEGSIDAFSFVDDTKYGAVGVESTIKIKVNNQAPIAPRHVCILRITVQTSDMRTIVVKELVQDGATYDEFRLIQNLING